MHRHRLGEYKPDIPPLLDVCKCITFDRRNKNVSLYPEYYRAIRKENI
jgi:hypothetical protein